MAKKSRTPPPPRSPVQAPKRRVNARQRRHVPRAYIFGFAAAGLAALAIVLAVVLLRNGGGGGRAAIDASRACRAKTYPDLGARHVESLNAKIDYNSTPPTSGPHYYLWAVWGAYTQPVPKLMAVHNLEHTGLVLQYGTKVPRATVEKLDAFYREDPNGLLMFPNPKLGRTIALTTWTQLMTCTAYDPAAFRAFRDKYRYAGPERFPKQALDPGQGPQSQ